MSASLKRSIVRAVCTLGVLCSSQAQETADLPKVRILGCEEACAKWTDPKPKGEHSTQFPIDEIRMDGFAESFVLVRFTVTADGHVKDPVLVKLIGPPAFGEQALQSVKHWEYVPATADGKPADRPNWYVEMAYRYRDAPQGARKVVYTAFKQAQELLAQAKFAEADTLLMPVLNTPRLSFYERAMVSLLLSISHGIQKDYAVARDYADDATLLDARYLPDDLRETAMRQRIRLEAATGQYGDALEWFEKLKSLKPNLPPDDHEVELAGRITNLLAKPDPIRVVGRVSTNGPLHVWNHQLLRRNFAFPVINGTLTELQLSCDQKVVVSPITTKAEWHVPKSWSGCTLRVEGEAGATFQLVETNE